MSNVKFALRSVGRDSRPDQNNTKRTGLETRPARACTVASPVARVQQMSFRFTTLIRCTVTIRGDCGKEWDVSFRIPSRLRASFGLVPKEPQMTGTILTIPNRSPSGSPRWKPRLLRWQVRRINCNSLTIVHCVPIGTAATASTNETEFHCELKLTIISPETVHSSPEIRQIQMLNGLMELVGPL